MATLRDTTIDGTLTGNDIVSRGGVEAGDKARIWTDSEGGNMRLYSPNNIAWEMDAYNDDFRLIYYNSDLTHIGTPFSVDYSEKQVYFYNTPYGKNKVLWSGTYYMTSEQTAALIEPISSQAHGIILVWVAYVNGAVQYCDYVYSFIPKWHVSAVEGCGCSIFLSESSLNFACTKYVYISNTTIKGHVSNANNSTTGVGINVNGTYWVLSHVIGV